MRQSLFLIGARAVGKTFLGRRIAKRLGYEFFDTDLLIQERAGRSIAEIVRQRGWPGFRALERQVVYDCALVTRAVVATGGGAVLHGDIWPTIRQRALVVWLRASVDTVLHRMAADPGNAAGRPALTAQNAREEYETILRQREPLYRNLADCIIEVDSLDSDRIVADIVKVMRDSEKT